MNMYCKIKRPDNSKETIVKGEKVVIQEKIDGSNVSIFNDNGNIRYFSRTRELFPSNDNDRLNVFINYVKGYEDKIKQYLQNGYVLFGEWLGQGKINYNSLAKQGKIEPLYIFDLATKVEKITKTIDGVTFEDATREFAPIEKMKEIATKIGFKLIPELEKLEFTSFDELKKTYVDNQKSALEGTDSIREGIVIKTIDGKKRIKIVADKFKEVKTIKNTETKSPYSFLDKYITPMRICKFLTTLGIDNPSVEDYPKIFKSLDTLSDDIIQEEKENIIKDIARIIRKQAIPNIKEYVENGKNNFEE